MSGYGGIPASTVSMAAAYIRQTIFDHIYGARAKVPILAWIDPGAVWDKKNFHKEQSAALSRCLPYLDAAAARVPDARFSITHDPRTGQIDSGAIATQIKDLCQQHSISYNIWSESTGKAQLESWNKWADRWLANDRAFRAKQNREPPPPPPDTADTAGLRGQAVPRPPSYPIKKIPLATQWMNQLNEGKSPNTSPDTAAAPDDAEKTVSPSPTKLINKRLRNGTPQDKQLLPDDAERFPYLGLESDFDGESRSLPRSPPLFYKGDRHLFLVGPSGSGKGMRLLVPQLATLNRSILVIDPKGELAAITASKREQFGRVVILNPFGLHADKLPDAVGFNPIALLDPDADDFPDRAKGLSEAIIKIEGTDPHWSASAQQLVAALIMYVRIQYGAAGSLVDVRRLLCEPSIWNERGVPTGGLALTALAMIAQDYAPLTAKAGRFAKGGREIDSVVSAASTQTEFIDSLAIARNLSVNGFDFADMKNETVTVYLILPAYELEAQSRWLRLIIVTAMRALLQTEADETLPPRPPVLFILDEFAQLGHLAPIESAMGIARGYGIQLWPILQDINQIKDLYEKRWETFIGNAGIMLAFTPNDMTTSEQLSRRAGQKEVESKSQGQSVGADGKGSASANVGTQFVPRYRPEDLLGMSKGEETKGRLMCFHEGMSKPFFTDAPFYNQNDVMLKRIDPDGLLNENPYRKANR